MGMNAIKNENEEPDAPGQQSPGGTPENPETPNHEADSAENNVSSIKTGEVLSDEEVSKMQEIEGFTHQQISEILALLVVLKNPELANFVAQIVAEHDDHPNPDLGDDYKPDRGVLIVVEDDDTPEKPSEPGDLPPADYPENPDLPYDPGEIYNKSNGTEISAAKVKSPPNPGSTKPGEHNVAANDDNYALAA